VLALFELAPIQKYPSKHLVMYQLRLYIVVLVFGLGAICCNSAVAQTVQLPTTPIAISPDNGEAIKIGADLTFAWQAALNAVSYDFFVYDRTIPGIFYRIRNLAASTVCTESTCSFDLPSSEALPISIHHQCLCP